MDKVTDFITDEGRHIVDYMVTSDEMYTIVRDLAAADWFKVMKDEDTHYYHGVTQKAMVEFDYCGDVKSVFITYNDEDGNVFRMVTYDLEV